MKVFYAISNACWVSGGAERAALMMLRRLREHYDFECEMLSSHPVRYEEIRNGVRLRGFRDIEELKTITRAEKPDIILGSLADAVPAFQVGCRYGIPRILSIHGYEYSPPTAEETRQWLIPAGHRSLPQSDIDFVLKSADHVFSCSQYMQRFLRDRAKLESEILLNDWDEEEVLLDDTAGGEGACITAICGNRHKGVEIFLELASRFPNERFMLVGDPGNDIPPKILGDAAACRNVELPGRMRPREFLARSKLVLVPSQWPEPFGRIAVEAMVNGIPVLASRNGGLRELVGNGPMGVDAFGDVDAWEDCLRAQIEGRRIGPAELEAGRVRARTILAAEPVHLLARVIKLLSATSSPAWKSTSVAFTGGLDGVESNTIVNAAWSQELATRGYAVGATEDNGRTVADYVLLHDYSKNFNDFVPPEAGYYIAVRSSDFGPYPRSWAEKIEAEFDQLWVYTEWIAEQARASGIDPALIRVVPLGIDPHVFRLDGPVSRLVPRDTFTFLFVGGAVRRKGIDLLIKAYRSVFSSSDNVALVIKGDSENMFYKGRSEVEEILASGDGRNAPRVVHIDVHLSIQELAAMYRSCDVGVFPYRAEGFVLPIAEAMASGTPSIVPDFGPCLDFCSASTSFLVPARRIRLPFSRTLSLAAGFEIDVEAVDFCEVRLDALGRMLRQVFDAGRAALGEKRQAGIHVVRHRLSWASSVDHVEECLRELGEFVPRRIVARRDAAARVHRREAALREMAIDMAVARQGNRGSR